MQHHTEHVAQSEVTPEFLDEKSEQGWKLVSSFGPWKHPFGVGVFSRPFVTLIFRHRAGGADK